MDGWKNFFSLCLHSRSREKILTLFCNWNNNAVLFFPEFWKKLSKSHISLKSHTVSCTGWRVKICWYGETNLITASDRRAFPNSSFVQHWESVHDAQTCLSLPAQDPFLFQSAKMLSLSDKGPKCIMFSYERKHCCVAVVSSVLRRFSTLRM